MAQVLVVDDEFPIRDLLTLVLEDLGHVVLQAANGCQALDACRSNAVDLVISDVMMPFMDGIELSQRLKSGESGQAMPIILMSAAGSGMPKAAVADSFIGKPYDVDTMEYLVSRYVASPVIPSRRSAQMTTSGATTPPALKPLSGGR